MLNLINYVHTEDEEVLNSNFEYTKILYKRTFRFIVDKFIIAFPLKSAKEN